MTGSLKRRFLQAPILPEPGDKSPVDYSIDLARHHRQLTLWNYNRLLILTVVNIVCAVVYLVVAATGGLR